MPKIVNMMRVDDGTGRELLGVVLDVPPSEGSQVMLVTEDELNSLTERAVKKAIAAVEESHDRHVDQLDECYALLREMLASDFPTAFFATRIRMILGLEVPN